MTLADWRDGSGPVVQVLQGDGLHVLAQLEDGEVDAVVTDPPWNLGKPYGRHDDDMPRAVYLQWLASILRACRRVSRHGIVLFLGEHNLDDLPRVLDAAGLAVRIRCHWHAAAPHPRTEPIVVLHASDGTGPVHDPPIIADDVDPFAGEHPCPKPVSVVAALLNRYVPAGGSLVDPFVGSGSTLAAAAMTRRRALGVELEPRFCDLTRRRLESGLDM